MDIGHRLGRGAAIGDHLEFDTGAQLQELPRQVREAADAGHGIGELAGLFSCEIDQLPQGFDSEFRRHSNCQQLVEPITDCREVARHHQRQVWRLPRHGEE
jgi:hypothetical protein